MMELYSIASGSSGNCIFVGEEKKGILIDAGISKKRIEEGLAEQDIFLEEISGIFITHEHSDHISGLGPILRKYAIPVYATEKTIDYLLYSGRCGKMDSQLFQCIHRDVPVSVGGWKSCLFRYPMTRLIRSVTR